MEFGHNGQTGIQNVKNQTISGGNLGPELVLIQNQNTMDYHVASTEKIMEVM